MPNLENDDRDLEALSDDGPSNESDPVRIEKASEETEATQSDTKSDLKSSSSTSEKTPETEKPEDKEPERKKLEDKKKPVSSKKTEEVPKASSQRFLIIGGIVFVILLSAGIAGGIIGGIKLATMNQPFVSKAKEKVDSPSVYDETEISNHSKAMDKKSLKGFFIPPEKASGKAYYFTLKPSFLISLLPSDSQSSQINYLQIRVSLMMRNHDLLKQIKKHQSLIKNDFLTFLSTKNIEQLKTKDDKALLALELLQVVRKTLNQSLDDQKGVENVFFVSFVTQ